MIKEYKLIQSYINPFTNFYTLNVKVKCLFFCRWKRIYDSYNPEDIENVLSKIRSGELTWDGNIKVEIKE